MSKHRVPIRQPFVNPGNVLDPTYGRQKPAKPCPEFPLFPHNNGQWAKKVRGRLCYFGSWTDTRGDTSNHGADAALAKYLEEKDDLHAGRTPKPEPAEYRIKDACNGWLNHKRARLEAGELSLRTWAKYRTVADLVVGTFGKLRLVADLRADDFAQLKNAMTKRWGPYQTGDFIQHVRSLFKHAFESEMIDRPVRFGPGFDRPSAKTVRLHKVRRGPKLFTRDEVRKLIDAADVQTKASVLLAINAGLGNSDVAALPISAVDLDGGWLDFPRPKTGVGRRCPLWPETTSAIREVLASRPRAKAEHAGLVFLSRAGTPLISVRETNKSDGVAQWFGKLLRKLSLNRRGVAFYALRHTHRTVSDGAKDQPAADHIMGHEVAHMSSVYREGIDDARLKAVSDHVRNWLFETPVVQAAKLAEVDLATPTG